VGDEEAPKEVRDALRTEDGDELQPVGDEEMPEILAFSYDRPNVKVARGGDPEFGSTSVMFECFDLRQK
jgi:hypothetical protein